MGQFIKFGETKFAGEGSGNLTWKRSADQQFDAGADMQLRGFQLSMAKQLPWREDSVLVYASAKGQTNFDAKTRIDAATLTVKSGTDQIDAKILEPVKDMQGGGVWKVWARMVGQLQNWPARLAAFVPTMNTWQLAGGYIVEGDGTASKDGGVVRQMGFAAEPLIVKSPSLNINETRIEGSVAGRGTSSSGVYKSRRPRFAAPPRPSMLKTSSWPCLPTGRWNSPARSIIRAMPGESANGSPIPKRPIGKSPDKSRGRSRCSKPPASCMAQPPPNWTISRSSSAGKQFQEPIVSTCGPR